MSDTFDPYEKWLGIPRSQQPASHYRLLGVPHLTSDADMIANAADQRMIYLRTFRTSEHRDLAERLLGEVAAARGCLLDPAKKSAYDVKLSNESRIAAAPGVPGSHPAPDSKRVKRPVPRPVTTPNVAPLVASPDATSPAVAPSDDLGAIVTDSPRSWRRAGGLKKKSGMPLGLILSLAVGGVGVLSLGLFFMLRSGDPSTLPVATHTQPTSTTGGGGTDPAPSDSRPTAPTQQPTTLQSVEKQRVVGAPAAAAPRVPALSPAERAAALTGELKRVAQTDNLARTLVVARELAELEGKDGLARQAELFTAYAGRTSSPLALKQIVNEAGPLVHAAVKAERGDVAQPCAVQALVAARRLDDPNAIRDTTFLVLEARKTKTR